MMIKNLSNEALLSKTKELVREETRVTTEILHHLREIESRKLFASLSYSSLYEYATQELGYSEDAALLRIDSMRLLKEIPQIESQIQSGELTLSVLGHAQRYFRQEARLGRPVTKDQKEEVVQNLQGKSSRSAKRALLSMSPEPEKHRPETVRPVSAELSEVRFLANDELLRDLEKLKGLLAHRFPEMSLSDLIAYLSKEALKDLDPAQKEVRAKTSAGTPRVKKEGRTAVPAAIKREVWRRDGSRCTFTHQGKRCESRRALEIDHRVPVALGGGNEIGNLRLLCPSHNAWEAARVLGTSKIRPYWETQCLPPGD